MAAVQAHPAEQPEGFVPELERINLRTRRLGGPKLDHDAVTSLALAIPPEVSRLDQPRSELLRRGP
jgi:hypothetical protein